MRFLKLAVIAVLCLGAKPTIPPVIAALPATSAGEGGTNDFGAGGIATDIVAESTASAGVTVDGVFLKDERWNTNIAATATGDSGITLKDNLASAWDAKEGSGAYMQFVTTNSSERTVFARRLTVIDAVASGTERVVGGTASSQPTASTAITGTQENEANFDVFYSLPAGTLKVGTHVRIHASGLHTVSTDTDAHRLGVRIGSSNTVAQSGNIDPAANDTWLVDLDCQCRAVGVSGTVVCDGRAVTGPRGATATTNHILASGTTSTTTSVVDTTIANNIAISIDRAATDDADSARLDALFVEIDG